MERFDVGVGGLAKAQKPGDAYDDAALADLPLLHFACSHSIHALIILDEAQLSC